MRRFVAAGDGRASIAFHVQIRTQGNSMRTERSFVGLVLTLLVTIAGPAQQARAQAPAGPPMTLTIPSFPDGGQFPVRFSQAAEGVAPGEGTSPAMSWANAP